MRHRLLYAFSSILFPESHAFLVPLYAFALTIPLNINMLIRLGNPLSILILTLTACPVLVYLGPSGPEFSELTTSCLSQTYIIVKPPPTNSKNPLNLQIQLIVKPDPRSRDRTDSTVSTSIRSDSISAGIIEASSISPKTVLPSDATTPHVIDLNGSNEEALDVRAEAGRAEHAATLRRSSSMKSSDLRRSSSASTSSTSGGGQKKRVEPMFNLTVHNVMQNTVVNDAATDVKVAKVSLPTAAYRSERRLMSQSS